MKKLFILFFVGTLMAYDPRTGITTYDDPAVDAATTDAPADVTATGMLPVAPPAAPQGPQWNDADYDAWAPSADPWFQEHEVSPIAYAVSHGIPLPKEIYDALFNYINTQGGVGGVPEGVSDNDLFGHWIATIQDKEDENGAFEQLGLGGSVFEDVTDRLIGKSTRYPGNSLMKQLGLIFASAAAGSATEGATGSAIGDAALAGAGTGAAYGLASEGNLKGGFKGAAKGGVIGGAAGAAGSEISGMLGPTYGAPTASFVSTLAKSGGNIRDALLAAGITGGSQIAAPYVNAAFDRFGTGTGAYGTPPGGDEPKSFGRLLASGDGPVMDVTPGLFDADTLDRSLIGPDAGAADGSGSAFAPPNTMTQDLLGIPRASQVPGMLAGDMTGVPHDPLTGEVTGSAVPILGSPGLRLDPSTLETLGDIGAQKAQESQTPSEESQARIKAKDIERLANIGAALAKMHGGQGTPEGAPQREEGQSDADYVDSLVKYANIDPAALAEQGLTPGSPEYYQAVMDQMDSIIAQLTDGLDVNGENLSDELRLKTREEIDQLGRALYVRGQLGTLMGSGQYTDPFTGISEDVIAPEGQRVQPSVAAYHRGLARSADELARLHPGQDAKRYIGGMLSREPDLFGMQASADEQALQEAYAAQGIEYDPKRRRGMFSR